MFETFWYYLGYEAQNEQINDIQTKINNLVLKYEKLKNMKKEFENNKNEFENDIENLTENIKKLENEEFIKKFNNIVELINKDI